MLLARITEHDRTLFESPRLLRIHRRFRAGDAAARPVPAGLWHRRLVAIETSGAEILRTRHSALSYVDVRRLGALTIL